MKFLRCYKCGDMVALRTWVKSCYCGECYGKFLIDNRTVIIHLSRFAQVLGTDNEQFEPISYMVCYQRFDKDKPVESEIEIIKKKWEENPELGLEKLLESAKITSEDELEGALKKRQEAEIVSRELNWRGLS